MIVPGFRCSPEVSVSVRSDPQAGMASAFSWSWFLFGGGIFFGGGLGRMDFFEHTAVLLLGTANTAGVKLTSTPGWLYICTYYI